MALFDNDFMDSIVTEGKDCDKDCKKDKDVDEEKEEKDDDVEEEISDDDAEEAEEAAQFDVEEAASIADMKGIRHPLADLNRDCHYTCLEFVGTTIALDKLDVACTESYVTAATEAEKEAVTEEFKDSVKTYYQKFKNFILKIKNMIVRFYNRAKNYMVNFIDKVISKIATLKVKELDTDAMKNSNKTLKVFQRATGPLSTLTSECTKLFKDYTSIIYKVASLSPNSSDSQVNSMKEELAELDKMKKDDIRAKLLGEMTEVSPTVFSNPIGDIKKAKVGLDAVNKTKDEIMKTIKAIEASVYGAKQVTSNVMAIKVTAVNKIVGFLNRIWAVLGTAVHHWLAPRITVVRTYGKRQWREKKEETKESFSLLEQFEFDSL